MLTCYEAATNGNCSEGFRISLGALVYYKPPKHRELPAFDPRTCPGIFVGWRVDAGFAHRKVHLVLDKESLRTRVKGYGRPIQVYESELVEPSDGKFMFLMYEAGVVKYEPLSTILRLANHQRS